MVYLYYLNQWGQITCKTDTTVDFTFPITFNSIYSVSKTLGNTSQSSSVFYFHLCTGAVSTTKIVIPKASAAVLWYIIAIGA